ncbi:MAG: hypothetical protein ABFD07_00445 [Methanobacterium sp.]
MANRKTRLITKHSTIVNRPLPVSLLTGEAIVNTADGIVFYSGVTTSTNEWTPAGSGLTANFFEVGSNLYDLRLRNKITKYEGQGGSNLVGKFLSGTTSGFVLANISDISSIDTYVTGYTYNPASNTLTILQNEGKTPIGVTISSMSGLSISNLGNNRIIYTTGSGQLTTESGFEYSESANTLTVGNINILNPSGITANIGQGGLVIGSGGSLISSGIGDLIVHGNLTVFGTETIVATNELYVEDPQLTLNYNPTGSTILTSVSSGIRIQDGNGLTSGDTYFTIGQMQNLTSGDTSEYTGLTGYNNRGWVTQLNDIVIRNTNKNEGAPDGVRVLAEFDILDGGTF